MRKHLVILITMVFCLALCACTSTSKKQEAGNTSSNALEVVGDTTDAVIRDIATENDAFVEKLISFGFTEEEAIENAKILKQCGVPSIDICEPTDPEATIDGLISYRGKFDDDRILWFTVENRKIFYVSLNGEDLYDEDKGGYLKDFEDIHIPETYMSEETKSTLKSQTEPLLDKYFPYDARYYDAWAVGREDNLFMVQCQISDGSILSDDWLFARVWYELQEDGTYTPTGVEIDGRSYAVKE